MGLACGGEPRVTPILASGSSEKLTDMECTHGLTVTDTKASFENALNMEKVSRNSLMGIFIKGFMLMVNLAALESTTGSMVAISRDYSKMDCATVKVFGKEVLETAISIKGST